MSEERPVADGDAGEVDELLDDLEATDEAAELPELESGDEPAPQPEESPQRNRAIRQMRDRLRQEREDNRRLRASVDQLLVQQRQQPQIDPYRAAEAQRLEQERIAQMMPHEQASYFAAQAEGRMRNEYMRARLEVADLLDRQGWQQLCRDEPHFRKYSEQVESMLAMARNQGQNPTRETLANLLLAQEVRERSKRSAATQRRNGRAAIARETTVPGSGRSTAAPARGGRGAADDYDAVVQRLRNTRLGDAW